MLRSSGYDVKSSVVPIAGCGVGCASLLPRLHCIHFISRHWSRFERIASDVSITANTAIPGAFCNTSFNDVTSILLQL
jgi:hypothetical protein